MIQLHKILLLSKREWKENQRTYLIGFTAMMAIFSLLFAITWHFRNSFTGDTSRGIFLLGLFGGGSLFAAAYMRDLGAPAKAVWQICLPSSIGEKVVVAILFSVVYYLLTFLLAYYLVEFLFRLAISDGSHDMLALNLFKNQFYDFIYLFVNLQLLMLIGSIVFRKAAFLKTLLLIIVLFFLVNLGNNALLAFLTGEKHINGGAVFDYFQFVYAGENVYVNLPEQVDTMTTIFFHFLLPFILSAIMYFKLKETEFR
jgi:hypothetical protein